MTIVLVLGFVFSLPTIPSIQLPLKRTIHFAQPTLFFEDEDENDPSFDHQALNLEGSCEVGEAAEKEGNNLCYL